MVDDGEDKSAPRKRGRPRKQKKEEDSAVSIHAFQSFFLLFSINLQKYGRKVQVQVTIFHPSDSSSQKLVCLQFLISFEIDMNSFPIH